MNETIRRLLSGEADNHILPFFWQHGEEEGVLREHVRAIHSAGCMAFCVESRPHPDFCGPKWWADMDAILDEARKLGMRVWILDDSHFPTGFANGAVLKAPASLCRQNLFSRSTALSDKAGPVRLDLKKQGLLTPLKKKAGALEKLLTLKKPARLFDDDQILGVFAKNDATGETADLGAQVVNGTLLWEKPAGAWTLTVLVVSRNTGYHRDYINMLERDSCKLLIDAVYEPHFARYQAEFGHTIAGFFSDEPELGNGELYETDNPLGAARDLPWSEGLEGELREALGESWRSLLTMLWQESDPAETARVRYAYMDAVTRRVRDNFSYQLGDWCRARGVEYIGHVIEDQGQHCRTGSSLGHYFRSLEGQDMAGIDDIGGQVLPQGEDGPARNQYRRARNGEFYHYALGKLAQSAAAIEPNKRGRAMCEIFGNYGWTEGVRLEKYLADHFLVRGVNYFVPHAFSPKAFPDPDCPPHFYAHGHDPQFRHFGKLMGYMNRAATLTSSGKHKAPVAILYHGESEWAKSDAMPFEKPLRALYDAQIDCHVLPADVFARPDFYKTELTNPLVVNGQRYEVFVVPAADYIPKDAAQGLAALCEAGLAVLFTEKRPRGMCEGGGLPAALAGCPVVALCELAEAVLRYGVKAPGLSPASDRVRVLHIQGDTPVYMLVNEADKPWEGVIAFAETAPCRVYDAWENRLERAVFTREGELTKVKLTLEPLKSVFLLFDEAGEALPAPIQAQGTPVLLSPWRRALCEAKLYPAFGAEKEVRVPDALAKEQPKFSGYARYTASFHMEELSGLILVIEDAAEGVEVFVNGQSAGIQIAPPFRYDITALAKAGENQLSIEVATTLERACYPKLDPLHKLLTKKPSGGSGLTGGVLLTKTPRA